MSSTAWSLRSASLGFVTGSAATLRLDGTNERRHRLRRKCSSSRCGASSHGRSRPDSCRRIPPTASRSSRRRREASHLGPTTTLRARWPLGTRQRVAFEVLRELGVRRGDAVRVGPPHVRDGIIRLATEKTGERVAHLVSDVLAAAIEAGPVGEMTFIVGADNQGVLWDYLSRLVRCCRRLEVGARHTKGGSHSGRDGRVQRCGA